VAVLGALGAVRAAQAPIVPLTVCEVLRDLPALEDRDVTVLGRYSYRETGRWVGEQACAGVAGGTAPQLWMVENATDAPRPPENFELDGSAVLTRLRAIQRTTSLGKFRFATPDYDKWAVVFGRVEKSGNPKQGAANLVYRGSGAVIFLDARRE
jgi:hypothetical protein